MTRRSVFESRTRGRRALLHPVAVILTISLACIAFVPPLALDGRLSYLEYALLTLGVVLMLALLRPSGVTRVRVPVFVIALLAVMAITTLWSFSRAETARDVFTFMVIALAAIVLVQISSLNSIAAGVALSGVILLIWCGILILLRAENVFTVTGDLLGPYGNRNGLAYALLQSVPAALAMRFANRAVNVAKWSIVTALCFGIFATGSKTSLLVLLILFAFACGYLLLRWKRVIGLAYIAGGVFLVAVAALNFETVLGVLGKTDSISGRIPMWAALVPLIAARPITGYGWSLALPVGAPPSVAIQETLFGNAVLYHAHNEVLNWLITTGIVGALLVLAIYGLVLWAGIRIVGTTELVAASWISMGGLVLLLRGTTDISETLPQGWFILMILAAASVKFMPDSTSGLRGKWLWINANRAGRVTSTSTRVRPRERGRGATQFNNPSELEVYSGSESASFKE